MPVDGKGVLVPLVLAAIFLAGGCGSDGGDASDGVTGGLRLRIVGQEAGDPRDCNRLGPAASEAIRSLRLTVTSDDDERFGCCVAFDPCDAAFEDLRRVVLPRVPVRDVEVGLSAFPGGDAPAIGEEALGQCATIPEGIGRECATEGCAILRSFGGDTKATLKIGTETDVEVPVTARMFLQNVEPTCGAAVGILPTISFDVVSAAGVETLDGTAEITQSNGRRACYFLSIRGGTTAITDETLGVTGQHVVFQPGQCETEPFVGPGPAMLSIRWGRAEDPTSILVSYGVTLQNASPSSPSPPTPSPTPSPISSLFTLTPPATFTSTGGSTPIVTPSP